MLDTSAPTRSPPHGKARTAVAVARGREHGANASIKFPASRMSWAAFLAAWMKDVSTPMLSQAVARVVAFSTGHVWAVILASAVLAAAGGTYAARHFSINADVTKLISPDLPWRQREVDYSRLFTQGTGLSKSCQTSQPPGPYTSAELAADLRALVTGLGLGRFHLAGVSMGGAIAQEYAVAHPAGLRSLVLANTFAAADPFTAAAFDTWAMVALQAGMPAMMRAQAPWIFSPEFYERHPDRVTELIAAAQASTQPPAAFAAQMAALTGHDCAGRIGAVRVPTLVLAARDDIIIRPQLSRRLLDALAAGVGTWAEVPGGHAAFWENPAPWNQAVTDFVRAASAS